ncbi:hypothetical protein [Marinifilum sp. D714]|uniref:hypothetical protein n=1 Tax=Marinifilum sp. D714 TaxID=2937523 RepID=UPI0027BCD220|nr:hypothetical protein [Marinifilum sp. D714]MDQ2180872.1 hypothetical protein [Marinifilum sp. D714]
MKKLDEFGKKLIQEVRDLTTEEYISIKSGQMKSSEAQILFELISGLNSNQQSTLDSIVGEVIDRALHNTLRMFESSESMTVADKEKIELSCDIVESSDGLSGELYGDNGWFVKYSNNYLKRDIY